MRRQPSGTLGYGYIGPINGHCAAVYPSGVNGVDQGEVLRSVFLFIKRQNKADNVGR